MKFKVLNLRKTLLNMTSGALLGAILLCASTDAVAVSQQEMDQAKAIAAQKYLRYKNNGAAYLDKFTPASMSELKEKLQGGDKDAIKSFEGITPASDYASWDKAQLVAYWSDTFFKDNKGTLGLNDGYDWIKGQVKKTINNKMSVSGGSSSSADGQPAVSSGGDNGGASDDAAEIAAEVDAQQAGQDLVAQQESNGEKKEKKSSGTWVYIMILGILVVVVVFLVMYASRTMKTQPKVLQKFFSRQEPKERNSDYAPKPVKTHMDNNLGKTDQRPKAAGPVKNIAEETRMREKYAENLASKSEEIRSLTRQLNEAEAMIARLREENARLKGESNHRGADARHISMEPGTGAAVRESGAQKAPEGEKKEVYLGRVNSKGLFVRADRQAVEGQSIYKLTTSNGVSGSYTVINNPVLADMMLEEPGKWLSGGCFAKDIFDTDGKIGVITETPGTAVFRDGAWRVDKKAKIRYE